MKQRKLTRRYVYNDIYKEVMLYSKYCDTKPPNNNNNFPFYLEQYIKYLKEKK